MKYSVKENIGLLDFLIKETGKKRNDIKNLLKYKNIYVNGNVETYYAYELKIGDSVDIDTTKQASLPFPIVYEDKDIIVINKPCGLLTEKTNHESQKTAYHIVKDYLAHKKEKIYLVHRLDQYTSGLLMFVKNQKLYDLLTQQWNEVVKVRGYVAVVEGKLNKPNGVIINYLTESKSQNVYITSKEKGKKAITHYKQIQTNGQYTMVNLRLDTGRKNQIRVHMSSLNHPIIGDEKYGAKTNPIHRLGLHAHELMFIHPLTHQEMRFVSHTPESFEKIFNKKNKRKR